MDLSRSYYVCMGSILLTASAGTTCLSINFKTCLPVVRQRSTGSYPSIELYIVLRFPQVWHSNLERLQLITALDYVYICMYILSLRDRFRSWLNFRRVIQM